MLRNLRQLFDWQYIGQIIGGNFLAFSEYMNFIFHRLWNSWPEVKRLVQSV